MKLPESILMPTETITPYAQNIKKHTKSQIQGIAESIKRFGFYAPIVVDKNNVVVIGHGRLEAAKLLGLKEVPCIKNEELSDDEARALRLLDNRISESEWDLDNLKLEIESMNFDFEPFKVSFDELYMPKLTDMHVDIDPGDQHMQSYLHGNLKQITLVFDNAEFERTMRRIELAAKDFGVDTNAEVFLKLLDEHETK